MAGTGNAIQEQLDELGERIDAAVQRMNAIALGGHNSNPHPAPAHNSESAAAVFALDEQTKELRRLRQDMASLPARIAGEFDDRFAIEEELEEQESKGKQKGSAKGGQLAAAAGTEEEPVRRRRGYYDAKD
jgi:hypothetical protein